jgi:hypothetical protein
MGEKSQSKKNANVWLNLFNATKRAWSISIQQQMNCEKIISLKDDLIAQQFIAEMAKYER